VKQQDAKLPWHWKISSTLQHIANWWRRWKLERKFGQRWATETIVFHPVISTLWLSTFVPTYLFSFHYTMIFMQPHLSKIVMGI
jgi:hypothetical protein